MPHYITKRNHSITKVKARFLKKKYTFGVQVPRSVREAYMFDEVNGNTLWRDTIEHEMINVVVSSKVLDDD